MNTLFHAEMREEDMKGGEIGELKMLQTAVVLMPDIFQDDNQ
jgi:hypothetical protein